MIPGPFSVTTESAPWPGGGATATSTAQMGVMRTTALVRGPEFGTFGANESPRFPVSSLNTFLSQIFLITSETFRLLQLRDGYRGDMSP